MSFILTLYLIAVVGIPALGATIALLWESRKYWLALFICAVALNCALLALLRP